MNFGINGTKLTQIIPSPYQLIPLLKLIHSKLNAILICDDVGLGKTISAGYILQYSYFKFKKPCIVVVPPNLISKWDFELKSKFNFFTNIVKNRSSIPPFIDEVEYFDPNLVRIHLISNTIMNDLPSNLSASCILFDEIHRYRNNDTRMFQSANNIVKSSNFRVGLTATPINNLFTDLINELSILLPYPNITVDYLTNYMFNKKNKNTNPLITNFQKSSLGYHFTTRNIQNITVKYPDNIINETINLIDEIKDASSFYAVVTYYRLLSSNLNAFFKSINSSNPFNKDPKIQKLINLLKKTQPNKAIIFCAFVETVKDLSKNLSDKNVFTITGKTKFIDRDMIMNEFKNTDNSVLILSQVGSEGIDLQFCDFLINYDLHWNPMVIEQRIGRIDRRGQTKSTIHIYNFHVIGSIDDHILRVLNKKLKIIQNAGINLAKIIPPPKVKNIEPIYDEKYVQNELKSSNEFVESIQKFTTINNLDYEILNSINPSYCLPDKLLSLINNQDYELSKIWKTNKDNEWINNLKKQSKLVTTFLEDYS